MTETRAARDRRDADGYLDRAWRFLIDDFGYAYIGQIAVISDDVTVRGYINQHAGRQIEMSGHPPGVTFFGGLRKLIDGVPAPYDRDHFVSFDDLAMVRRRAIDDRLSHNSNPNGWRGVVDTAVELIKSEPALVAGRDWVPRASVAAEWRRHFLEKFGFAPDDDLDWPLSDFKSAFSFLLARGYQLIYDTTTLTPHEYGVTDALRYVLGSRTVTIECVDFREGEWQICCDGEAIGGVFRAAPEEINAHAELVKARAT